ncbi:hypothetical protein ACFQ8C_31660 [Streptomyces sp. NPDC056503]|uniref:hypothetical protein n=1 Tax=Streptomyces sp. NPDC056503 TaxID=3345842 RepID=UPI0036B817A6
MRIKTTGLLATATLALVLTACGTSDTPPVTPADKAGAGAATAAPTTLSPAAKAAAREAAGLPPEPDAATAATFIAALDAIDKDIVHGKQEKAISRGLDTCSTYKRYPDDTDKQIDQTNRRWSSPAHPDGHGLATAKQIRAIAHKHLCPTF